MGNPETAIATCLSRLENLMQSVGRLQKAHISRGSDPSNERTFREIRLAKAAIEADYEVLKSKLNEVRASLGNDEQRAKSHRRQALMDKVFTR
ncbi:MAG: hypothetical protein J0H36_06405 [Hyphomicrobium denitrificans]|nr:hypothetical protein [Hyphomicrobium denitrificans]